ncbi:hypothetical protein ACVH9Z_27790 [Rhodococcus opacus]
MRTEDLDRTFWAVPRTHPGIFLALSGHDFCHGERPISKISGALLQQSMPEAFALGDAHSHETYYWATSVHD